VFTGNEKTRVFVVVVGRKETRQGGLFSGGGGALAPFPNESMIEDRARVKEYRKGRRNSMLGVSLHYFQKPNETERKSMGKLRFRHGSYPTPLLLLESFR